ncbi:alanine racemase C-terminal domain-containing protein, partial [Olsenella sp. HMSC062G07]|uniref:alanine racemase C-terminal domain-containing protein n=1 Tax=Olsenella sp. HMSC062G07 TaxID=1739330 RepID=UPI002739BFAE
QRQVGRICMDQLMFSVDVSKRRPHSVETTAPVAPGDVVTIMGRDGDEYIGADEMATLRDTINYEVTCNFGQRLPKVYV